MNFLIQRIYGSISMILIDMLIEEQGFQLAKGNPDHEVLMQLIYESNDLDERHMFCARFLGYVEEANYLFQRMVKKSECA